ncbi:MAG: acyltransferase family protein, partial [Treponema sp.]|nr:acyltransferase family protein [Treponema sp.]
MSEKRVRYYYLDALKFLSMMVVFLCHFRMAFFYDKYRTFQFGKIFIPNYLFNGNLAVCMFLLISVFIYVQKTNSSDNDFIKVCIKRFFRFFIPVLFVNLVIFIMYLSHLFFNINISKELSVEHINSWFNFGCNIKAFVLMIYSNISVCFFQNSYNPPLWCYNKLFLYPLIIYGLILLVKDVKLLTIISIIFLPIFLLHNSYF